MMALFRLKAHCTTRSQHQTQRRQLYSHLQANTSPPFTKPPPSGPSQRCIAPNLTHRSAHEPLARWARALDLEGHMGSGQSSSGSTHSQLPSQVLSDVLLHSQSSSLQDPLRPMFDSATADTVCGSVSAQGHELRPAEVATPSSRRTRPASLRSRGLPVAESEQLPEYVAAGQRHRQPSACSSPAATFPNPHLTAINTTMNATMGQSDQANLYGFQTHGNSAPGPLCRRRQLEMNAPLEAVDGTPSAVSFASTGTDSNYSSHERDYFTASFTAMRAHGHDPSWPQSFRPLNLRDDSHPDSNMRLRSHHSSVVRSGPTRHLHGAEQHQTANAAFPVLHCYSSSHYEDGMAQHSNMNEVMSGGGDYHTPLFDDQVPDFDNGVNSTMSRNLDATHNLPGPSASTPGNSVQPTKQRRSTLTLRKSGMTRYRWSPEKIQLHVKNGRKVPSWANDPKYSPHLVWSYVSASGDTSFAGIDDINIGAGEILTFLPSPITVHGVTHRLARNCWMPANIAHAINHARCVDEDSGVRADSVKHQLSASDVAYYGTSWAAYHKAANLPDKRPTLTDYTPQDWRLHGASLQGRDKGRVVDPPLISLAAGVLRERFRKEMTPSF
ncbi:hypothetical protein M011DRAFT_512439 [Sporormia fimetaria CBS 119925]|uniref:Uncharacterized protein n=1 Tax=Sporormia fimetaria CBS 119925 TaxID=1340428 RepID=A0A6A6UW00_9PLEO|nr:hypothetical protein M011DRAFT_512439 [Sporormia fimetaria CBS 119925]